MMQMFCLARCHPWNKSCLGAAFLKTGRRLAILQAGVAVAIHVNGYRFPPSAVPGM
jgi:hypothetical protein